MSDAFLRPPTELLGLTLRPLTAGTDAQLDRVCAVYRQRLKTFFAELPDDRERNLHSMYWYMACFIFLHTQPAEKMRKLAWDFDQFDAALTEWLGGYSREQIMACAPGIAAIRAAIKQVNSYTIDQPDEDAPDPNSSSRDGSPAISAASQGSPAGAVILSSGSSPSSKAAP